MPDVFEDTTTNTYDLTVTTSADWTVSSGGMPNGDNYTYGDGSIAATYNTSGSAFDFSSGSWTLEFWFYYSATSATDRVIIGNYDNGTTTLAWNCFFNTAERIYFQLQNTSGAAYTYRETATLSQDAWHHVVCIKESGVTPPTIYVDNATSSSNSGSASGTARTPGASYRIYLGTNGDGTNALDSGIRIAKMAIFDSALSTGQINDHYLAMTAT